MSKITYLQKKIINKLYLDRNKRLRSNVGKLKSISTEELYQIYNDSETKFCSQGNKLKFNNFTSGYLGVCDDKTCKCKKEMFTKIQENIEKTNINKYGVACTFAVSEFREKAKKTKLEKYGDENYNNTEKSSKSKRKNMEDNGIWVPLSEISDWNLYKRICLKMTNKTFKKFKNEINPNNLDRRLCGVDGGYQLDHIISVFSGFKKAFCQ